RRVHTDARLRDHRRFRDGAPVLSADCVRVLDHEPARSSELRRRTERALMKIPIMLRIAVLVVATTGFYAYVGQMVPQKEVQPPAEIVLKSDLSQPEMAKVGREIMDGKGLCLTCHTI